MRSRSFVLPLPTELVLDDALELSLELALELWRDDCRDRGSPFLLPRELLLLWGDIPAKKNKRCANLKSSI